MARNAAAFDGAGDPPERRRIGPFELDDVQSDVDRRTEERLRDGGSGFVVAPPGFGKGLLIGSAVAKAREGAVPVRNPERSRPRVLLVVPGLDLVEQTFRNLLATGAVGADEPDAVGVLCAPQARPYRPDGSGRVPTSAAAEVVLGTQDSVVASANTRDNFKQLSDVDLVVFDEAHRAAADNIGETLQAMGAPTLGWTATPFRSDDRDVAEMFGGEDGLVRHVTAEEAQEVGRVVPGRVVPDARERTRQIMGRKSVWRLDDAVSDLESAGASPGRASQQAVGRLFREDASPEEKELGARHLEATVSLWAENARDRTTLVFAENIDHARSAFEAFRRTRDDNGDSPSVLHVDSKRVMIARDGGEPEIHEGIRAARKRREALDEARRGAFDVVTNCDVFREGVDVPRASAVICACREKETNTFLQSMQRASRAFTDPDTGEAKKDFLLMDQGNTLARLATREPRFRSGDVDMRGVRDTSVSAGLVDRTVSGLLGAVDDGSGSIRHVVRDHESEESERISTRLSREGRDFPGPPDDPAAEGVKVERELDDRGRPHRFGRGDRVYATRSIKGVRAGPGTVLGVSPGRGRNADSASFAVLLDRDRKNRPRSFPVSQLIDLGEARRGAAARDAGTQRRWAEAGAIPESISEVLEKHPPRTGPPGTAAPGNAVYSWYVPDAATPERKVGPATLLRTEHGSRVHHLAAGDGSVHAVPGGTVTDLEDARRRGLVVEDERGRTFHRSPARRHHHRGEGRDREPFFEHGDRVFFYPERNPRDGGSTDAQLAAGFGRVTGYHFADAGAGRTVQVLEIERDDHGGDVLRLPNQAVAEATARREGISPENPEPIDVHAGDGPPTRRGPGRGRHMIRHENDGVVDRDASPDPALLHVGSRPGGPKETRGLHEYGVGADATPRSATSRSPRSRDTRDTGTVPPRGPSASPGAFAGPYGTRTARYGDGMWLVGARNAVPGSGLATSVALVVRGDRLVREITTETSRPSGDVSDIWLVAAADGSGNVTSDVFGDAASARDFMRSAGVVANGEQDAKIFPRGAAEAASERQVRKRAFAARQHASGVRRLGIDPYAVPDKVTATLETAALESWRDIQREVNLRSEQITAEADRRGARDLAADGSVVAATSGGDAERRGRLAASAALVPAGSGRVVVVTPDGDDEAKDRTERAARANGAATRVFTERDLLRRSGAVARGLRDAVESGDAAAFGDAGTLDRLLPPSRGHAGGRQDPRGRTSGAEIS